MSDWHIMSPIDAHCCYQKSMETCEIPQWVETLDNMDLLLRIYMVVGESQLLQAVLLAPHSHTHTEACWYMHTPTRVTCTHRYIT